MSRDYSKTIIYKLCCLDTNITDIYVGHTTNKTLRIKDHKVKTNNGKILGYNYKVYEFIRNNGGWDNWSFIELEYYPCENRNQAETRERFWYDELKATLNTKRPKITEEELKVKKNELIIEWRKNNIKHRKEYYKQYNPVYYEEHKNNLLDYAKTYRETNKEIIKQKQKEYYEKNKERFREYSIKQYKKNKVL